MKKIKRNKHFMILLLIFILTLGYASVTTILNMNGSVAVAESDFKIKFNRSVLNKANRPTFISKDGSTLSFKSGDITEIGESILDYEIVNASRQYDANVQVTCSTDAKNVTIENTSEIIRINSGEVSNRSIKLNSTKREENETVPSGAIKLYDKVKGLSQGLDTVVGLNYNDNNKEHGVYETINTDSGKSVYFYRGNVNNNIIFANTCWNIIRTTETGGTKLIYNGIPINGSCDQNKVLSGGTKYIARSTWAEANDAANAGYMFGNIDATSYDEAHQNLYDSNVKKIIDKWYEEKIKDTKYEEMLEDTVYCSDRSLATDYTNIIDSVKNKEEIVDCEVGTQGCSEEGKKTILTPVTASEYYGLNLGYAKNPTLFSGSARIDSISKNVQPSLKCALNNDRFTVNSSNGNGALKYPIATITADETIYAGYSSNSSLRPVSGNTNIYLHRAVAYGMGVEYNQTESMWTMTPMNTAASSNQLYIGCIHYNSSTSGAYYKEVKGVNPVLSLNNDNYIVSGDGSVNNPYVLFTKGSNTDKITCTLDVQKVERDTLGDEFDGVRSLYDEVKLSSLGTDNENKIDYNTISSDTNGKGVYETSDTDSGKPVYFYRGNVEDNNVIFADKCWQIIRTTSSSGTKLVYNGEVGSDGTCNNTGEARAIGTSAWNPDVGNNAYAGYMIGDVNATTYAGTHNQTSNSAVKTMIDSWYEANIKGTKYEELLEDIVFCNDRSIETDFSNYTYKGWLKLDTYTGNGSGATKVLYQSSGRVGINAGVTKPTLTCSQLNDRYTVSSSIGNGALTYPIGLMTADETVFAGATGGFQGKNTAANNFDYYLFIGGKHSWTMTPHRSDTTNIMLVAGAEGNIGNEVSKIDSVLVRPVISIKNDIMIVDGHGTKDSPYILKAKKEVDASRIPVDYQDDGVFSDYYVDAYRKLNKMTLEEKVGQLIMAHHNQANAVEGVIKYNLGGYTYFEADFLGKTEEAVKKMIADEQAASKIPLITAVDEEGGRVVRIASNTSLVSEEKSKYPNLFYTNTNNKNAWKLSKDLYTQSGNNFDLIKQETIVKSGVLKRLGLNVNFAPVVDMAIEGAYISDRVIGLDANGTAEFGKTVINTSKGTGVSYTLKHFPGYGNNSDTHTSGAIDNKSLEELMNNDIVPFKEAINEGAEAVMLSHNTVVAIDANNPSSLSKPMHELLTNDLNFTGIIITDALDMGATKDIEKKFIKAINAGNHLILVQKYADAYNELLDGVHSGELSEELVDKLVFKILAWKYYKGIM